VSGRSNYFWFGSVFIYKNQSNQKKIDLEPNRNRPKPTGFDLIFASQNQKTYVIFWLCNELRNWFLMDF
jgi:hypothetical protein